MMIYNSSHTSIQQSLLSDIKLVVIDKSHFLHFFDCPSLVDIIPEEYQLWKLVLSEVHVDIKLNWEEASFAIHHRDINLFELLVVVV